MPRILKRLVIVPAALLSSGILAHAEADDSAAPVSSDRSQLALAPSVALTNVGVDTNILGTSQNPRRDTTATLRLQAEPSWSGGALRVSGKAAMSFVYFRQYVNERSVDTDDSLELALRLNRLTAYASGSFLRTRDPFDPEIYVRTRRTESSVESGADLRVTGKTRVRVAVGESRVDFSATSALVAADLRDTLNRHVGNLAMSVRNAVTPLTTVVLRADLQRDRFDFAPIRDANGARMMAGAEFKPTALIAGTAYVGYRRFDPLNANAQRVSGVVGSVDLAYTLARSVRCSVRWERDLAHSFTLTQPYFTVNGVSGSLTRRLMAWDIVASAGRQRLDYGRSNLLPPLGVEPPAGDMAWPVDSAAHYAVRAEHHGASRTGVAIEADYDRLRSSVAGATFDRLRILSSIGYRFHR